MPVDVLERAVYNLLTIYMLALILRWLGAWIGLEMEFGRWRFLARITDPVLNRVRKILPSMGPVDFAPLATLFFVWIFREVSRQLIA
jgi:YggT family protein